MLKGLLGAGLAVAAAAGVGLADPAAVTNGGVRALGAVAAPAAAPQFRVSPPVPTPLEPGNGDTVLTITPIFEVEAAAADSFHFRVMEEQSTAAQGYSPVPSWEMSKSGFELQRGHRYHWSCRMKDSTGWSPWFSPDWEFVVGFNLPAPEPKLPQNGATVYTLRPFLVVKPVSGPVRYHFAVWDGKTLAGEIVTDLPNWIYDGQSLRYGNMYQWTCRVETPSDTSGWFEPEWTFEVAGIPAEDGIGETMGCIPMTISVLPNPFSERVEISLGNGECRMTNAEFGRQDVRLEIFSTDGRMVRAMTSGSRPTRSGHFVWDGRDQNNRVVGPGTYFCRIVTESGQEVFKLARVD